MHILQFKWLAIIHTHSHTHTHRKSTRDGKRVAANSECIRCHSIIHLERQAIASAFLYFADCIIVEMEMERERCWEWWRCRERAAIKITSTTHQLGSFDNQTTRCVFSLLSPTLMEREKERERVAERGRTVRGNCLIMSIEPFLLHVI